MSEALSYYSWRSASMTIASREHDLYQPARSRSVITMPVSVFEAGTIITEFSEFLSIPNVAADPVSQQKTVAFIMAMMNKLGIQKVQLLNASTAGAPPASFI